MIKSLHKPIVTEYFLPCRDKQVKSLITIMYYKVKCHFTSTSTKAIWPFSFNNDVSCCDLSTW